MKRESHIVGILKFAASFVLLTTAALVVRSEQALAAPPECENKQQVCSGAGCPGGSQLCGWVVECVNEDGSHWWFYCNGPQP